MAAAPSGGVSGYRNKDGAADWNADMSELKDVETLEPEGGRARWGWKDIPNKARAGTCPCGSCWARWRRGTPCT